MVRYLLGLALPFVANGEKPTVPVLNHIQMLQELKQRIQDKNGKPVTRRAADTPTKTHMAAVEANGLSSFWSTGHKTSLISYKSTYKDIVAQALEREYQLCNTHYVFYHGQNKVFRVFQDFLKELYTLINIHAPLHEFEFLRMWHKAETTFNAPKFVDSEDSRGLMDAWSYDHRPDLVKNMLCVNLSLFGGFTGEQTFDYFMCGSSVSLRSIDNLMTDLFDDFGFNKKYLTELHAINNAFYTPTGNLMQIFIPKDRVDDYVYLSQAYGVPHRTSIVDSIFDAKKRRHIKISPILDAYIKGEKPITTMDPLQGRILLSQDCMLNPNSGVKIFRYTHAADEQIQTYKDEVKQVAYKVFADALENGKFKNIGNTPLHRLLGYIPKGVITK